MLARNFLIPQDRFEYGKFTKELQHADFAPVSTVVAIALFCL